MPRFKNIEDRLVSLLNKRHNINSNHILYEELFNFYMEFTKVNVRLIINIVKHQHSNLSIKERYVKCNNIGRGVTLEKFLLTYGEVLGKQKWENYIYLQRYTNSLEYKSKKYGMTNEEFSVYNKSRAATMSNMIKRHGEVQGNEKYKAYCERQSYTNSLEYCIEKHGQEKGKFEFDRINSEKSMSLSNFIRKHGEHLGKEKYQEYIQQVAAYYSAGSQELALGLEKLLLDNGVESKIYFATKNKEFGLVNGDTYVKYDFVDTINKICIEYNGDLYHANPKTYLPSDVPKFRGNKLTARQIWEKDKIKQKLISDLGYTVVIVWESDYNINKELTIKKVYDELYRK